MQSILRHFQSATYVIAASVMELRLLQKINTNHHT
jgi:excinuclease UvrABC nuclease subunit